MNAIGVGNLPLTRWEAIQRALCSVVCRSCGWSLRKRWRWTPFYFAYQAAGCRIITLNYAPLDRFLKRANAELQEALELTKQ